MAGTALPALSQAAPALSASPVPCRSTRPAAITHKSPIAGSSRRKTGRSPAEQGWTAAHSRAKSPGAVRWKAAENASGFAAPSPPTCAFTATKGLSCALIAAAARPLCRKRTSRAICIPTGPATRSAPVRAPARSRAPRCPARQDWPGSPLFRPEPATGAWSILYGPFGRKGLADHQLACHGDIRPVGPGHNGNRIRPLWWKRRNLLTTSKSMRPSGSSWWRQPPAGETIDCGTGPGEWAQARAAALHPAQPQRRLADGITRDPAVASFLLRCPLLRCPD